jgi:hypothetical protein
MVKPAALSMTMALHEHVGEVGGASRPGDAHPPPSRMPTQGRGAGGPFAGGPTVERPGYRMLAAIVRTPEAGNYYLKFYGPTATVEQHAAGFQKMIEGMVPAAR